MINMSDSASGILEEKLDSLLKNSLLSSADDQETLPFSQKFVASQIKPDDPNDALLKLSKKAQETEGAEGRGSHLDEWTDCSSCATTTTSSPFHNASLHVDEATDQLSSLDSLQSSYPMSAKRKSKLIRRVLRYFTVAHHHQRHSSKLNKENVSPSNSGSSSNGLEKSAAFRQLAISRGGLVKDEYRRQIWTVLAENLHKEVDDERSAKGAERGSSVLSDVFEEALEDYADVSLSSLNSPETPEPESKKISNGVIPNVDVSELTEEDLKSHSEWDQVEMDVCRTLARFPPGINDQQRQGLLTQLTPLIVRILWHNPSYRYYQGFHDVCLTLLLVLGVAETSKVGAILARDGIFHEFLTEPLDNCQETLKLIFVIIWQTDPELEWFFRQAELGTMFSLSWLLTWFGHAIDSYDQIVRLYDLFLSTHKLMPVYFAAALILFRGADVRKECECEMPQIHSFLSRIPDDLPLEALISDAQDLFVAYPPSKLTLDLSEDYERDVREQAVAVLERRPYDHAVMLRRNKRQRAFAFTFWAVTASAAAWYLYSNSSTFLRFIG